MIKSTTLRAVGLCLALLGTHAHAQLNASLAGLYTSGGDHAAGYSAYATGAFEGEFRSFFVFDLPVFSQTITSARLDIFNSGGSEDVPPGFYSEDGSETLSFFNVSTPIATLTAGGSGLTGIFDDLGSGTLYGSTQVSDASNGVYVSLFMNNAFLSDLTAGSGGSIALGAALTSLADPNGYEFVFGNTDLSSANPAVRLTLEFAPTPITPIPEPSTYALFGAVLLGLIAVRRRFSRRSNAALS